MADYDEREYDSSLPETTIEELLATIHILYRMVPDYKQIDDFLFNPLDELEGIVPIEVFMEGEGLTILEYIRDVEQEWRIKTGRGPN